MNGFETIAASWQVPGLTLIVSDPEQSSLCFAQFREQHGCKMLSIPTNSADFAGWSGQLSQSFLGNAEVYWGVLPAVTAKNNKIRAQIYLFLKNYSGPHAVWLLVAEEQATELSSIKRITVTPTIGAGDLQALAQHFGLARSAAVVSSLDLIPPRSVLSLDVALSLLIHAGYTPTRNRTQAQQFLQKLLPQDVSFSLLAELFFKQDWETFLSQWAVISGMYSDMFWISFWAEQLWRSYWVCWYMTRGQQTRARSMSYRLPATFVQSGWRTANMSLLCMQYEYVSFLDTSIKFGSYFSIDEVMTSLIALSTGAISGNDTH